MTPAARPGPGSLSSDAEDLINDLRRLSVERDEAQNAAEQRRREAEAISEAARELEQPERKPAEQLIDFFEKSSLAQIRERDIEQKYGRGMMGWYRRLISGTDDVSFDERGGVRQHVWREAGRRALRIVFNRRTMLGAGALATIGFLTGGAGLMAWGAFSGGVAGRIVGEATAQASGRERKARAVLLSAQSERWLQMQKLAREYQTAITPERKYRVLMSLADEHLEASDSALRHEISQGEEDLANVLARQNKLRNNLELAGYVVGTGAGFLAAKATIAAAAAHGTQAAVEAGHQAFGAVDTDLNGVLHQVYQENGQWNYLYNSAPEALAEQGLAAAQHAPLTQIPLFDGQWAHLWGNADQAGKIYAYAGAKALGVLGATFFAGLTGGDGSGRPSAQARAERTQDIERARRRITESTTPPKTPTELAAGQVIGVRGLESVMPTVMGRPWNKDWQFARVTKIETQPGSREQSATVMFYRNSAEMRGTGGTPPESFVLTPQEWTKLRTAATNEYPSRPLTDEEREELKNPRLLAFFKESEGKKVKFVDKPTPDNLKILVDQNGWPQPGALDPKGVYSIERIDLTKDVMELRDAQKGGTIWVSILGLRKLAKELTGVTTPSAATLPPTRGPDATAASTSSTPPGPEARIARRSWREIIDELRDQDEPEPRERQVWILADGSLEAEIAAGRDRGDDTTLAAGRYQIQRIDRSGGYVILKSLADPTEPPARVKLENFAGALRAEVSRLKTLFDGKRDAGQPTPDSGRIEVNQRYRYRFTGDPSPDTGLVDYRVVALRDNLIELVEHAPAAGAAPLRRRVNPLDLAEKGEFIP